MPLRLDRTQVRKHLEDFTLQALFIEELGWDHGGADLEVSVADTTIALQAIAQKRGMVVYQYVAVSESTFPDYSTRRIIEKRAVKTIHEHIIIYATHNRREQQWQWVKRELGQPDRQRSESYRLGDTGERLIQKLQQIVFTLDEEDDTTIGDVSSRVRVAFDVEKVTKRFYDRFKKEHDAFLGFIDGITAAADREWYASLMLNRMMFIYFIQKRGFLDADVDYLHNRLKRLQAQHGRDRFQTFYRLFLLRLFHEGLSQPAEDRTPELEELLGEVPYLNGGLFEVHDLERDNPRIHVPDEAFSQIFDFFDAYQWYLDDRPLRNDNEINPDVLGYIFEKYVNQKQMGAYYTKEDITGYISRNTILPFLFDRAQRECAIAFKLGGGVWRLLSEDPDRYVYPAVRHGITYDIHKDQALTGKRVLPPEIAAGLQDVSQRGNWNQAAPPDYALPTETWREHVARRQRYEEVRAKLAAGEVTSINDLITYNLDIETFTQDVITGSEGPELVRAFWKAISQVSVLDPTCGSGAFLFAALNILEPLYTASLEVMRGFLDDLQRSQRKHDPERLSDFRKVLQQVSAHASERYFILKSIIIDNLYGVDIMEEAVEICKLRLFLKLVAELERYEQIEPLPDIDFNIRVGNTLVGFASLKGVQDTFTLTDDGQHRMLYPQERKKLRQIEEDAAIADRDFGKFRDMQTGHGMHASAFTDAKLVLRKRLNDLREELDRYLAGEYGVEVDNEKTHGLWRESHQPFHWFAEFYGIMRNGGFDVIIGNPPYVEYRKVTDSYKVLSFYTKRTANLYSFTAEQSERLLCEEGRLGLIMPVSFASSDLFESLRELFWRTDRPLWLSHFSNRPGQLFSGAQNRLTIFLTGEIGARVAFSTRYHRWDEKRGERSSLFQILQYVSLGDITRSRRGMFCKIGSKESASVLEKIDIDTTIRGHLSKSGPASVHWVRVPGYFCQFFLKPPMARSEDGKEVRVRGEVKTIYTTDERLRHVIHALLNSSTYFLYFSAYSDGRHINPADVYDYPFKFNSFSADTVAQLKRLSEQLQFWMMNHTSHWRKSGLLIDSVNSKPCKPILDEIDRTLAKHYGFADEELDFIINYNIKYRMGQEAQITGT